MAKVEKTDSKSFAEVMGVDTLKPVSGVVDA